MVMPVGFHGQIVNAMLDSGAMVNVIDITKRNPNTTYY